jgi:hypothetical protein
MYNGYFTDQYEKNVKTNFSNKEGVDDAKRIIIKIPSKWFKYLYFLGWSLQLLFVTYMPLGDLRHGNKIPKLALIGMELMVQNLLYLIWDLLGNYI